MPGDKARLAGEPRRFYFVIGAVFYSIGGLPSIILTSYFPYEGDQAIDLNALLPLIIFLSL
jgi:hypothetical protein